MSHYSEERIQTVGLKIHDRLYLDELVDYTDEDMALKVIKKAMTEFFSQKEKIDTFVRQKIASLKRVVPEGSPEWDILYKKYFEEERSKKG